MLCCGVNNCILCNTLLNVGWYISLTYGGGVWGFLALLHHAFQYTSECGVVHLFDFWWWCLGVFGPSPPFLPVS